MLSFAAFTEAAELPVLSDQLEGVLKDYNAELQVTHKEGQYLQLVITFN